VIFFTYDAEFYLKAYKMTLSESDADLFFKLMWSLQFYVNAQFDINPGVNSIDDYINLSLEDKFAVRERLFEETTLIDDYIAKNPDKFSQENLSIIEKWKKFVKESFHIERFLKSHAIFIADNKVYGVLGLYEDFDKLFHKSYLPLLSKAILLPFKGKIIYDGLLESYNVSFGSGIKRSLREDYLTAKQNGRIITSLENTDKVVTHKPTTKDWSKEIQALDKTAKKLKGSVNQPVIHGATFSLIKSSIELTDKAVNEKGRDELNKALHKVIKSVNNIQLVLDRMEDSFEC